MSGVRKRLRPASDTSCGGSSSKTDGRGLPPCALRGWIHHAGLRNGKPFDVTRYHICNRTAQAHAPERWLQHVRNHNPNLVGALALLRSAWFAIHQPHLEKCGGLNGFTDKVAGDISFACRHVQHPL